MGWLPTNLLMITTVGDHRALITLMTSLVKTFKCISSLLRRMIWHPKDSFLRMMEVYAIVFMRVSMRCVLAWGVDDDQPLEIEHKCNKQRLSIKCCLDELKNIKKLSVNVICLKHSKSFFDKFSNYFLYK